MKKVLSLVLAFAMILGSFGFVFGTQFPDVSDTEVFSEAVNVLSGLGVIGGYPDGNFKPANVVTRAEMATMLVNALGISVSGGSDTKFSDVPKSHWASGFISYATSVGFVAGYPDGTFKPEQQVTANEALTMIVASLGYTYDSLTGTYPGAFVNAARGLGILNTCRKTGTVGAERSDVACYLYDTLQNPIGTVNKDDEFVPNTNAIGYGGDTMLYRLGARPTTDFIVDGTEDTLINLGDYLGAYINAYVNKDGAIVALGEVKSEFIEGDTDTLADDYIDFKKANEVAGYISFNNGDKDAATKDIDNAAMTAAPSVKVAVKLSGKTIKEIYSAQIWTSSGTYRAGDDVQDEITDDVALFGHKFAKDDNGELDGSAFILEGDRAALSEIAEDDIVTIFDGSDGTINKIAVSTKTVEGKITKISTATNPAYTIDGKAYKKSADAPAALVLALKDEGTFFLDYAGKIFDFDATEGAKNYAIVLATGFASTSLDGDTLEARLLLADGTSKDFKADMATFGTDSNADGKGDKGPWASAPAKGTLVEYTLNSAGDKITALTAATGSAGAGKFDANSIYNSMATGDTTVIFSVKSGATDMSDPDSYEVLTKADLAKAEFKTIDWFVSSGAFKAVKVTGVSSSTKVFAIFASGPDATTADGKIWTVLYDGAVKDDMVLESALSPTVFTTTAGATLYTLTTNAEGIVTATPTVPATDYTTTSAAVTAATSVSGSVFKDGASASFSLDSEVVVYVYDESDDAWTAKTSSALVGRKGAFNSINLVDSDKDGDYDIAIVVIP
jgi:hypothetical protein